MMEWAGNAVRTRQHWPWYWATPSGYAVCDDFGDLVAVPDATSIIWDAIWERN